MHFEFTVEQGGAITFFPVEIYRSIKLNDSGTSKIQEARASEPATFPEWFAKELADAGTDSE